MAATSIPRARNSSAWAHGLARGGKRIARKLFEGEQSFQRIYVAKTGPFGLLPFFVLAGVIAATFFVFVLGAFLILLPIAGFLLAAAVVTGLLRGRAR